MGEWRTIESAPKDGTRVLVAREMSTWGWVLGSAYFASHPKIEGGWIAHGFGPFGELGLAHPTHWMPLPVPPELQPSESELEAAGQGSLLP